MESTPECILIRVYIAAVQRVPLSLNSLSENASFIAINYSQKKLIVWIGKSSSQVDRSMVQNLGAEISKKELKRSTAASHIPIIYESDENHQGHHYPSFFEWFKITREAYGEYLATGTKHQIRNDSEYIYLLTYDIVTNQVASKLFATIIPHEKGSVSKISLTELHGATVVYLVVGKFSYLWIPSGTSRTVITSVNKYLAGHSEDTAISGVSKGTDVIRHTAEKPLHQRQGMEYLFFKEHFTASSVCHNHDASPSSTPPHKSKKRRPIEQEVRRICDVDFGSLRMLREGGGDAMREGKGGLGMGLIHDESANLRVWRIAGAGRVLEPVEERRRHLFSVTGCYAVLITFKAGSKAVCYMWHGELATPPSCAALALQAPKVTAGCCPSAIVDHIAIEQGREPPILIAFVFKMCNVPLSIILGERENSTPKADDNEAGYTGVLVSSPLTTNDSKGVARGKEGGPTEAETIPQRFVILDQQMGLNGECAMLLQRSCGDGDSSDGGRSGGLSIPFQAAVTLQANPNYRHYHHKLASSAAPPLPSAAVSRVSPPPPPAPVTVPVSPVAEREGEGVAEEEGETERPKRRFKTSLGIRRFLGLKKDPPPNNTNTKIEGKGGEAEMASESETDEGSCETKTTAEDKPVTKPVPVVAPPPPQFVIRVEVCRHASRAVLEAVLAVTRLLAQNTGAELPAIYVDEGGIGGKSFPQISKLCRPRRLFLISDVRRAVGAMFIEEIGMGGVYAQSDLKPHEAFLLDIGRSVSPPAQDPSEDTTATVGSGQRFQQFCGEHGLYLWLGAEVDYKTVSLALRVTKLYASLIDKLNTELREIICTDTATSTSIGITRSQTPSSLGYGCTSLNPKLHPNIVWSSEEPEDFIAAFRFWYQERHQPLKRAKLKTVIPRFIGEEGVDDASRVGDVSDDDKYESDGEPVVHKDRISYKDTTVYKSTLIQVERAQSDVSNLTSSPSLVLYNRARGVHSPGSLASAGSPASGGNPSPSRRLESFLDVRSRLRGIRGGVNAEASPAPVQQDPGTDSSAPEGVSGDKFSPTPALELADRLLPLPAPLSLPESDPPRRDAPRSKSREAPPRPSALVITVSPAEKAALVAESRRNPTVLIGWRVALRDGSADAEAVFTVASVRTNTILWMNIGGTTEFLLRSEVGVDVGWVRLKRDRGERGKVFDIVDFVVRALDR